MSGQNQQEQTSQPTHLDIVRLVKSGIKPSGRHKLYLSLMAVLVFVFAYTACSTVVSHFNFSGQNLNTSLSDANLSSQLSQRFNSYQVSLKYPDGTLKHYHLSQFGLSLNTKQTLASLRSSQHKLKQRLEWWQAIPGQLVLTKDSNKLNSFLASKTVITIQPSVDASLTINNGSIAIANSVSGKEYGLNNAQKQLTLAAQTLNTRPLKLVTLALNPALTNTALIPYKATLAKVLNQPASFSIEGQSITPSPSQIAQWLEITPDDKTKKLDITVNSGKVLAYIDSVAAPLIHPAIAQVMVTQSDGSSQVLVPGVNGVDVTNKDAIAASVAAQLLNASGFNLSLPVNYQNYQTITAGDYPKWIEVDLTNKRLYAYEHASLVMTDLVTAGAPATPTVTGQYAIYAKYVTQNMSGENVDGSSYYQPNVPWINYFYKDYAIHGNYWRPLSYFGNVNSSHGCVGLMVNDAAWMYNWASIGTPVIIHS